MLSMDDLKKLKENIEKNLCEKVEEVSYLGRGACNNIYYCTTNLGSYSIKQERADKLDYEKNDLELEFKILKNLCDKKVCFIPEVVYFDHESKSICYKYIKGNPLEEVWPNLSEEQRTLLMVELGKFHHSIHSSITPTEAFHLGIHMNSASIEDEFNDYKKVFEEFIVNSDSLFDLLERIDSFFKTATRKEPVFRIIHGDLHQGNILIEGGHLSGIIDFGDCVVDNIERDFRHYARHYPHYLPSLLTTYENCSGLKINKENVLLSGLLSDIEKIIYHIKKYKTGKERLLRKLGIYTKILNSI